MKLHLVSFIGLAPNAEQQVTRFGSEENIKRRQAWLHASALRFGDVDVCHSWTRDMLVKTDYYQKNKYLLDQAKGCGYWAWKPFIILQTLEKMKQDDYLIYCDVGKPSANSDHDHGNQIEVSLLPLVQWADANDGMLPGVYLSNHGDAQRWIKRDCFSIMSCDEPRYRQSPTVQAGYTVWKNTDSVKKFLRKWQELNCDMRLISDNDNILGGKNYPGFERHCHDQATLTLLCAKEKVRVFGSKRQQFWGFRNINYIALEAKRQLASVEGELSLAALNEGSSMLVPNHLVRWLELLLHHRKKQALNIAVIGSLDEQQIIKWLRYLPCSNIKVVNNVEKLIGSYDCIINLALSSNQTLTNVELTRQYCALKMGGFLICGPLGDQSEFEASCRYVSEHGRFPDEPVFFSLQTSFHNPKIANSRNPIFIQGNSGKFCLMVKPKSMSYLKIEYSSTSTEIDSKELSYSGMGAA